MSKTTFQNSPITLEGYCLHFCCPSNSHFFILSNTCGTLLLRESCLQDAAHHTSPTSGFLGKHRTPTSPPRPLVYVFDMIFIATRGTPPYLNVASHQKIVANSCSKSAPALFTFKNTAPASSAFRIPDIGDVRIGWY